MAIWDANGNLQLECPRRRSSYWSERWRPSGHDLGMGWESAAYRFVWHIPWLKCARNTLWQADNTRGCTFSLRRVFGDSFRILLDGL